MIRQRLIGLTVAVAFGASCWSMGARTTSSQPNVEANVSVSSTPKPKSSATPVSNTSNTKMTETSPQGSYLQNLASDFAQPTDDAGKLLLREYGSIFVAKGGVNPPKKVVFRDEADVRAFQSNLKQSSESIGGMNVTLQTPAMTALKSAIAEARAASLTIGPRGADSSRRGYDQTVTLWASRVNPGFAYWVGKGRVTQAEATRIKKLSPFEQVPEILKLEQQGIYFAKDLSKSIIYSVAPPGTSQHISILALDVKEFENARVRSILANNGWFQTVASDLPHFTYLGVKEAELPSLGLKKVVSGGREFWVPDL